MWRKPGSILQNGQSRDIDITSYRPDFDVKQNYMVKRLKQHYKQITRKLYMAQGVLFTYSTDTHILHGGKK